MADYRIVLLVLFILLMDAEGKDVNLFYNENAAKIIKSPLRNPSQFGFSMTYQPALLLHQTFLTQKLVVGAPRADVDGQVYTCKIDDILNMNNYTCTKLPIDLKNTSKPGQRIISPTQEFWFGASLAATSEYIFICAPLWSDKILGGNRFESQRNGSFGHCYIFSEKFGTKSFSGLLESMKTENDKISSIGGFGWSMLIDERFDRWIIGKPALNGYFFDANLTRVKTQIYQRYPRLSYNIEALTDYGHVGNAFAIGNYFTDLNDTVLAFSATRNLKGTILFAQFEEKKYRGQKKGQYHILRNMATMYLELQNNAVGSMFGEALCAAELSGDGHDELVVGAPAYSDSVRSADVGAVHIYSSGTLATIGQHRRKFTIVGVQEGGYFGKAIINAGDLDADGFSEICVGAPYEDGGAGAVYVLSGKEVNSLLLEQDTRIIKLNEVKLVQRLRRSSTQAFGFSLLQLPDVDGNGCNELVVAAPRSDSLTLYRCSPSIKVSINLELQKFDNIPENVTSFEIKVCHRITYPTKPKIISNGLYVSNAITGNGVNIINKKEYSIEFRSRESSYCVEVPITVSNNYPGYYDFVSSYSLLTNTTSETDFDPNWIKIYPGSRVNQTLRVVRSCSTQECIPNLTADFTSSIGEGNVTYVLGSTYSEEVSLVIANEGDSAYLACVRITVDGPAARMDCARREMQSGYTCDLPKPFVKGAKFPIRILLDMTTMTNVNRKIGVIVVLDKNCDENNVTQKVLSYDVKPNTKNIAVEGFNKESSFIMNETDVNKSISFEQVFLITNNDSLAWEKLKVKIDLKKEKYLKYANVLITPDDATRCIINDFKEIVSYHCDDVRITPKSFAKISLQLSLVLKDASEYINNDTLNITSNMTLQLTPTDHELYKNVSHTFHIRKEILRFDQNKKLMLLLFIFLGLLLLIIVAVILYKCGFFKRKEKEKLKELKEEIRRESIRRSIRRLPSKEGDEDNAQAQSSGDGQETSPKATDECMDDKKQLVQNNGAPES